MAEVRSPISDLRSPTSGLDATGVFTRPELVEFHLPAKFRTQAVISVAQTAVGTWVFGYTVKFRNKWERQACRALGEWFPSRSEALRGGVLAIVQWLRERRGSQPARLELLGKCGTRNAERGMRNGQ